MAVDGNRLRNNFDNSKAQCLGKRDKSFAGRIDFKAVEICSVINEREEFYTTSSCAGRCFMYRGHGIKSSNFLEGAPSNFTRFRISHDLIKDAKRFFDLTTIQQDPSGGGDPLRSIGQFDHQELIRNQEGIHQIPLYEQKIQQQIDYSDNQAIWLRFEPFILHVCCRSLAAASALMAAARPTFKNVGLTSWKESKYLVAIWGDEGLDMPLSTPDGTALFTHQIKWLQHLINERHQRNWAKIDRFVQGARAIPFIDDQQDDHGEHQQQKYKIPKSYDVIGDVAVLYTMPDGMDEAEAGAAILGRNKAIKVCALRTGTLEGTERATTMKIIAGIQRDPLVTSHTEYGIKCVVDLNNTFFSPRMGPERLRICQQVARGEHVLVLFAGVGMEALQISGRTEAEKVVAIELNPSAVRCMINAHRMLQRSKSIKTAGAADRFHIVEGDVLDILPTLEKNSFDRILAPRPKEGAMDGDLGLGDGGLLFLEALLPVLKSDGGECHWYDFAADHEFPNCDRTKRTIESACDAYGVKMQMLHIANVGSIAKRQLRICADFRLCGTKDE